MVTRKGISGPVVLDCSAALAMFLDDEQPPLANALLDALPDIEFHVPTIWPSEFANALVMARRRRRLTPARAKQILSQAARLPLRIDAETATSERLFALASEYELTAYDAAYLDIAQRRRIALATFDKDLLRAAARAGIAVFAGPAAGEINESRTRYHRRKAL
jgi:predicted nucleic acid-binding protein